MSGKPSDRVEGAVEFAIVRGKLPPKAFETTADWVCFHLHERGESKAGLVLPENVENLGDDLSGTVICVGPEVKSVREGDEVWFIGGTNAKVTQVGGHRYFFVPEGRVAGYRRPE